MQQVPTTSTLGNLDEIVDFDRTATPAAFARSARGSLPAKANFGNKIQLIGYDLDTRRAYPGGRVPVTLYWQALTPFETSYQVFTHLDELGEYGKLWAYLLDLERGVLFFSNGQNVAGDIIEDAFGFLMERTFPR